MPAERTDIDPEKVEYLSSIGCTAQEIADFYGIVRSTLYEKFGHLLIKGKHTRNKRLREYQWQAAQKGNVTMQIWLGKQYLNQGEYGSNEGEDEKSPYTEG